MTSQNQDARSAPRKENFIHMFNNKKNNNNGINQRFVI